MRAIVLLSILAVSATPAARADTPANEVRAVITSFEDGMADRNVAHVQKTVGSDLVVIREGARSDGWEDFRDHRLIPLFAHPAPASKWELVKLNASADIAWAYTRTTLAAKGKGDTVVWTVFVLERRGKDWKIVLLDQNPGVPQPPPARKSRHH